jgi:protein-S-isoprenylcysteine O-methyltransferase Ste14
VGQLALLGTALVLTPGDAHLNAGLVLAGLVAWAATEAAAAARFTRRAHPPSRLGWLTRAQSAVCLASLWSALAWGTGSTWGLLLGGAALAAGVALRAAAIHTLGPLFLDDVVLANDHPRVTRGPYRLVRHPALAGVTLLCAGAALCMDSAIAAGVVGGGLLPIAAARIILEERLFAQRAGAAPVNLR